MDMTLVQLVEVCDLRGPEQGATIASYLDIVSFWMAVYVSNWDPVLSSICVGLFLAQMF
jgi:hypothetical protein